jgi:hypothetical protein
MIKFTRDNNRPHKVDEDFWVELSKIDTNGVEDPILAFMLAPDKTAPRIVHTVEYVKETGRITIYGTEYRWGWEAEDTMPWYDMNDTPLFSDLEVCGPEYLDYHHFEGSTRGVSMPDSIKKRIVFNDEVGDYVRNKTIEVLEGVCNTLWTMYGNVEEEMSAYDEIMPGSEDAKHILIEDNRWLRHECEELAELIQYNALPTVSNREEWDTSWELDDLLFFDVPREMENDGSITGYPNDGDGLELHDITLEEFNKVQRSLALTAISKAIQSVREFSVQRFQYDPHLQVNCLTVDDLPKVV